MHHGLRPIQCLAQTSRYGPGLCPRTAFLLRTSCNLAAQEKGVGFSSAQVSCFRLWVSGVRDTTQAGDQGSLPRVQHVGVCFLSCPQRQTATGGACPRCTH